MTLRAARNGIYTLALRSAALRWTLCAVLSAVAAVVAVSVGKGAVSETLLYLMARYPMPAVALLRAYALEPENPDASYRLALYYMDSAQTPDYDAAGRLLAESLAAAPNRFQTWLTLGRWHELAGRDAEAEQAYRRAAALAPSFWRPRWALGNLYIRQGRIEEGVEALRTASDRNTDMIALVVRTVWRATDGDVGLTSRAAGESLSGRSDLLAFLLEQRRAGDALAVWTDLAREHPEDSNVHAYGLQLAALLLGAGRVDDAIGVWTEVTPGAASVPERVQNPGFEEPIQERADSPFVWSIAQAPEARVSVDGGRSGGKALRVDYRVKVGGGLSHATQSVRVRPGAAYTLSFWARTDDLQSGGLPEVGISDAANRDPIGATRSLPAGTSGWTEYHLSFKAPSSGLVTIALERAACGDLCPIFGTVWIDDLSLAAN